MVAFEQLRRDATAAFLCLPPSRVVDEDLSHGERGCREEVHSIERHRCAVAEAQVGLVHQRRRPQRLAAGASLLARELPQLLVDEVEQPVDGLAIAASRRRE